MTKGDLVRHWLTEQLGIVIRVSKGGYGCPGAIRVLWTTQGLSMFGPGSEEWCTAGNLEVLSENR
tara:strand:+ start:6457 stop:6651 length:195 start_codon:yes stop_codon:yes gene_type:complete